MIPTSPEASALSSDPLAGVPPLEPVSRAAETEPHCKRSTAALMLGAMGVVFGDIGTSPLYALKATVLATEGGLPNHIAVMGSLSMIFWALILVVTVKYVLIIMRADNDGEGGTLALAALAHRSAGLTRRVKSLIGIGAIVGLALFFGDGMLTPAITVLSAVEGLKVESSAFAPLILPLALVILIGLFAIQSSGTHKIGRLFGPVMVLWFLALGGFGLGSLLQTPGILLAANPIYALNMFLHAPLVAFVSLGAVVLAVTGVMVIDTFNAGLVAGKQWRWPALFTFCLFGAMGASDLIFFTSNALKIPEGGWLPLLIASAVFLVMDTWRRGRRVHLEKVRSESLPLNLFLERADKNTTRVSGLAVFLSSRTDVVPGALLHNLKHNKVLHERVVLATVVVEDTPMVRPERRIEVEKLGKGFYAVKVHHGFFETPDVPQAMEDARRLGLALDLTTATFFIGRETLVPAEHSDLSRWRGWLYRTLAGNALSPARFYHLPPNRVVELGTQIAI